MKKKKLPELDLSGDDPLDRDLSDILAGAKLHWALAEAPKDTTVTLRLPASLVGSVKKAALEQGTKYQKLMRQFIVEGVNRSLPKRQKVAGRA